MIRNLKALGLALVAVFAMSALTASAASANNDVFTVGTGGTTSANMTGVSHSDEFFITPDGASFNCTTSRFAATATNNGTSATVEAEYFGTPNVAHTATEHCEGSIGEVDIDMNGCHYKLTGSTTGEDPPVSGKDATIWIECPTEPIKITGSATITVPSQTPTSGGVKYTDLPNHSGGAAVEITTTVTGITYSCHPTFICTLGGVAHHGNTADYTGGVTVTGWKDPAEGGLPTPVTESERVGVSVSTVS
jgi:hypothetical protein